jgi:ABC-2 type transport system permease protein
VSGAWAIARRDFAGFFRLPLGWVVMALFLALSGFVFGRNSLTPGEPASMREFFSLWWSLLLIVSPAISMRLLSEEFRTGTIEPLAAAPVSETAVVAGKFAAALGYLVAALAPTTLYAVILLVLAGPDPGPIVAGYAGVLLLGAYYLAVGLFISALTGSQTLAFLGALFTLLALEVGVGLLAAMTPAPWSERLLALSANNRLIDFARGLIDTGHVVFFVAAVAWFLTLAVVALKARRWR